MTNNATTAPVDEWLSERELCQRLHYSKSTITRLRKRGLPCIGTDRLRRYHWPTVIKWLSERA
jgi:hypothetical protein